MITSRGYTLVETMITLAIAGVLISVSLPDLASYRQSAHADALMQRIQSLISLARTEAAMQGLNVTFCPTVAGDECGKDWAQGLLLFTDRNKDRVINEDDTVLRVSLDEAPQGSLRWRAFGNRRYIQVQATGFLRHQNGNFTYCDHSGNPKHSRQLVVNAAGRVRSATDTDGDGVRENSAGKPLVCP